MLATGEQSHEGTSDHPKWVPKRRATSLVLASRATVVPSGSVTSSSGGGAWAYGGNHWPVTFEPKQHAHKHLQVMGSIPVWTEEAGMAGLGLSTTVVTQRAPRGGDDLANERHH